MIPVRISPCIIAHEGRNKLCSVNIYLRTQDHGETRLCFCDVF